MVNVYVGVGSNLNNPRQQVQTAILELAKFPKTTFLRASNLYQTAPVGVLEQPDFTNAVVMLETELSARDLLNELLALEQRHGRVRNGQRFGPRTLDLDLLVYGDAQTKFDEPGLIVPHPRMMERLFVLLPLADVAPNLILANGKTAQEALKDLHENV